MWGQVRYISYDIGTDFTYKVLYFGIDIFDKRTQVGKPWNRTFVDDLPSVDIEIQAYLMLDPLLVVSLWKVLSRLCVRATTASSAVSHI